MNTKETIELNDFYLLDSSGIGKIRLKGEYDSERLASTMVHYWIPFGECHRQCGRASYCKYVQWINKDEFISKEILCGVATEAITIFVTKTFNTFSELEKIQKQNYLNGTFHFFKFVFRSELMIGNFINEKFWEPWSNIYFKFYGNVKYIRTHINAMSSFFKDIQEIGIKKSILFVEGKSEEVFLNTLKESHLVWFYDIEILNYKGKGNKRPSRIEMLIDDYLEKGYEIYIQGDADGKEPNIFQSLIENNKIKKENTFTFKFDFESSVPPSLLFDSLKDIGLLSDESEKMFVRKLRKNKNLSISNRLKESYNIDLKSYKTSLAQAIANNINNTIECWQDEWFLNTELGLFLKFIQKMI